jgi:uncharacterized protein YukE
MYSPYYGCSNKPKVHWERRVKMVTPPEAFTIAAEFRRIADEICGYQQYFHDRILSRIAENWSGRAGEKYQELCMPIAGEIRSLCEDLKRRAVEIENIQIQVEWWEPVYEMYGSLSE